MIPVSKDRIYRVSGKVLVKETGVGIPNLQVVLYDLDSRQSQSEPAEVFENPNKLMPFVWQQYPGDRLGSVLTDEQGGFALTFAEEDFATREQINRPDLILFVMAPEDSGTENAGTKASYMPKSVADRILHYSYDPAVNSGRNEAYIIRIAKEALDRFEIPYADSANATQITTANAIATDLVRSFEFEGDVQAVLRHQTQERLKPALTIKKKTDEAFQDFTFSKLSREVRASATYFNAGENVTDKLASLISSSLASLPRADASARRKMVLHLTEEQIRAWGLTISNGTVSGEISISDVVQYIRQATGGGALENSRHVIADCSTAREAKRLFEEALGRCRPREGQDPGNGSSDEHETPNQETDFLLREQIARQMKHTTPPEEEVKYGVERGGEIISFRRASPADATAYHDFHEIRIAFDHIWTEAFDNSMTALLRNIYSKMVQYQNRVSGVDDLPPVHNIRDMRSLYDEFVALQQTIEDADLTAEEYERVPGPVKRFLPELIDEDWSRMTESERTELLRLAALEAAKWAAWDAYENEVPWQKNESRIGYGDRRHEYVSGRDARLLAATAILTAARRRRHTARPVVVPPRSRRGETASRRLTELMKELDERLAEPHHFDIFAPNSMNYGVMVTYRQKWVPGNYQVGEMVSTIPLAPKEIRKYTAKQVTKKSRTQKELEDSQSSRSAESSSTSRADSEITKQARDKTSFEATASGTVNVGVFQGEFGTQLGIEAEKSSSNTKKNFREAVLKAAEEYKQQHRLEVETSITDEIETTSAGELVNPNDEITVTYLFYELQRQYDISERIHRLMPVILVANEVPSPDEIDEDWLIAHDWILRRVILDDSFLPALHYVTTSIAGDELALQTLHENVNRQISLVEELTRQVQSKTNLANASFQELRRLMDVPISNADDAAKLKDIGMAFVFGPLSLAGSGDDGAAEKREEIAKLAIERADKDSQEVSAKLAREVTALHEAIDKYVRALQEHFDRQTAIARLRIHIKANIFFYMQAIWDYEPSDQRFFRLYNLDVPWIELQEGAPGRVRVTGRRAASRDSRCFAPIDSQLYELEFSLPPSFFGRASRKLSQVADLDNLLGYKGNYMIFPARQASYLHTYMMQDYIDPRTGGLRDPDEFSNYTTADLLEYACCMQEEAPEVFAEHREYLMELVKGRLSNPRRESELVVVPTGALYIEALPGKQPILEDFKLVHRALDVKKVQAEVRNVELENLRLAARLLEGEREDPQIDRKIVVDGNGTGVIVPPEGK